MRCNFLLHDFHLGLDDVNVSFQTSLLMAGHASHCAIAAYLRLDSEFAIQVLLGSPQSGAGGIADRAVYLGLPLVFYNLLVVL